MIYWTPGTETEASDVPCDTALDAIRNTIAPCIYLIERLDSIKIPRLRVRLEDVQEHVISLAIQSVSEHVPEPYRAAWASWRAGYNLPEPELVEALRVLKTDSIQCYQGEKWFEGFHSSEPVPDMHRRVFNAASVFLSALLTDRAQALYWTCSYAVSVSVAAQLGLRDAIQAMLASEIETALQ